MRELGLTKPSVMLYSPHVHEVVAPTSINQKAYIEVNETRTEVVAVTRGLNGCARYAGPQAVTFEADHPFMFMIMEDVSSIPLFVGAVVNPL